MQVVHSRMSVQLVMVTTPLWGWCRWNHTLICTRIACGIRT